MSAESLKTQLNDLRTIVGALSYDLDALSGGTKSAATAARAKLLRLSKISTKMRKDCLTVKADIPTKSRSKKKTEPEPAVEEPDIVDLAADDVASSGEDEAKIEPVIHRRSKKKSLKPKSRTRRTRA